MLEHLQRFPEGSLHPYRGRNHSKRIASGDRVVLWQSGAQGGVCGFATVDAAAADEGCEIKAGELPRIVIRHDRILRTAIPPAELRARATTSELDVLRRPYGANFFSVTDAEWSEVQRVSGGTRRPVPAARPKVVERPGDDPDERQAYARRVRRGQPVFRKAMLEAYSGRCAISGTEVANVLDACHISPHAETGRNDVSNGLLLRTDLHNLFDDGLLRIDPDTYRIVLVASLVQSGYQEFDDRKLPARCGGGYPDRKALRARWGQR